MYGIFYCIKICGNILYFIFSFDHTENNSPEPKTSSKYIFNQIEVGNLTKHEWLFEYGINISIKK